VKKVILKTVGQETSLTQYVYYRHRVVPPYRPYTGTPIRLLISAGATRRLGLGRVRVTSDGVRCV